MRFRAHEVAEATGGRLSGPDVELAGVSFDSRSIAPGQLFVPLVADRDGHEFIADALAAGAAAYLTSRAAGEGTAIEVPDTLAALMSLGEWCGRRLDATVIGITGSVGKTSTKDFAWAALRASIPTWANERSFNNDQGLPATIANAPDGTEVLVVEMGMRGFGEIARLCAIAHPRVGLVTRVAEAHGDLLGGIEGVATAKAELIAALPPDGMAILNADDHRVRAMALRSAAPVLLFGEAREADVHIDQLVLDDLARPSFVLRTPWGTHHVRLGVSGRHMALNAAGALACVGAVGGDVAAGAGALSAAGLTPMRMQVGRTAAGALLIDDSYNANPTSMRAALDALASLMARRRIAVLGLMAEITDAPAEHRAIAAYAAERGIEVIAVGTDLYDIEPTVAPLDRLTSLARGDAVLVKGSRVVGLDRLAAAMRDG